METPRGLGIASEKIRGRDALFAGIDDGISFEIIDPSLVDRDAKQVRKTFDDLSIDALTENIKVFGLVQPITVYREGMRYRIVYGERRWRASIKAGLKEIPAVIYPKKPTDVRKMQLAENLHRKHLSDEPLAKMD